MTDLKFYLDTADLKAIELWWDLLPLDGVTTNPTTVATGGLTIEETVKAIFQRIGDNACVHAQVVAKDYEGMVEEAKRIHALHKNIYVKIPVTRAGLKAIKHLAKTGMKITATVVASVHQGLLAAKAGAHYVAPYINRLDSMSADGIRVAQELVDLFNYHHFQTQVLGASYKNAQQVLSSFSAGIHAVTVSPELLEQMTYHPLTELAVERFYQDNEKMETSRSGK